MGEELQNSLEITVVGKGIHLMGNAGDATGLRLEATEARVGWPFSHSDLDQRGWGVALMSETNHLLTYILQQLLRDIAAIPHTFHHDPFLGFRPSRALLRH
jgi:hypothetical protein